MPDLQFPLTIYIAIAVAGLSFVLSLMAWNRRPTAGAVPLAVVLMGCTIWSLGYGIQQMLVDQTQKILVGNFIYIGIMLVPAGWFSFGMQYTGRGSWFSTKKAAWLALFPVLTIVALVTNPQHQMFYTSVNTVQINGFSQLALIYGPAFWLHTIYSYVLLMIGTLVLLSFSFRTPGLYRRQAWILVISALIPWILNILYLMHIFPLPGVDPTPLGFTISGLALILGVYRFHLLDLTPLARDRIVEVMEDGVVVLDENNRVVDCNPSAGRLLKSKPADLIGQPAAKVFAPWRDLVERYSLADEVKEPIILEADKQIKYYDLRISSLYGNQNQSVGRLILLRETTEARKAQEALQDSETKYRLLVDTSPDAIVLTDMDGNLVLYNQIAAQMHGVADTNGLNGVSVYDFVVSEDRERARQHSRDALQTGRLQQFEYTALADDGRQFPAEISLSTFRDQAGNPKGFICVMRDVSSRRLSEDEIRRMARVERTQREVADALFETSKALSETLDFETVLDRLLDQVARVVPYDSASVLLVQADHAVFARMRGYEQFGSNLAESVKTLSFDLNTTHNLRWMLENKQPLIIADTHTNPEWVYFEGTRYIRSWIGAPIITRGQVIGFLSLDKSQPDFYHPEHELTLAAFAAQAGLAMQNANLFAETTELLRREQQLNNILQIIGSSLDLSVVLSDILRLSCELVGADVGILGMLDRHGKTITAINTYNIALEGVQSTLTPGEGLAWDVVNQKKALLVGDYYSHPRALPSLLSNQISSALCAPVTSGDEVLGVLTFFTTTPGKQFQGRDVPLAEAVGREAGVSIQNSRLFAAARRRAEEAETVREAVSAVSSALELNWVLDQIITNLEKVVPFDSCSVFLQEGDKLRIVAARGFTDLTRLIGETYILDNPLTLQAFQSAKAVILPDASQDPRFEGWGDAAHVRGWMGVPLFARGAITGLLTIDSRSVGAYEESDASLAQAFANQAAIAIENARLFEKVQHLAITDPLTELYNRRYFFEQARREFYRARRYGASMSLMMLDVDDLKLVNDTYGHQIGDQLVEFIGAQCRSQLRQVDIPARYAGDEFIIALPETGLEGAVRVAIWIRERITSGFYADGKNLIPTSVTIGVSEMDADCFSLETLINRADQALYAAKQAGKNRVCAWQEGRFDVYNNVPSDLSENDRVEDV
ncbi:MAG: histidine kinase N-terminal 7TM domain-containing protein [Bellilinea sp.]